MENTEHTQGRVYHITVEGRLDPSWSDRLAGMSVRPVEKHGSEKANTTLVGPVRDQAELCGVLNTLYGLQFPLLSVETKKHGDTTS